MEGDQRSTPGPLAEATQIISTPNQSWNNTLHFCSEAAVHLEQPQKRPHGQEILEV